MHGGCTVLHDTAKKAYFYSRWRLAESGLIPNACSMLAINMWVFYVLYVRKTASAFRRCKADDRRVGRQWIVDDQVAGACSAVRARRWMFLRWKKYRSGRSACQSPGR